MSYKTLQEAVLEAFSSKIISENSVFGNLAKNNEEIFKKSDFLKLLALDERQIKLVDKLNYKLIKDLAKSAEYIVFVTDDDEILAITNDNKIVVTKTAYAAPRKTAKRGSGVPTEPHYKSVNDLASSRATKAYIINK